MFLEGQKRKEGAAQQDALDVLSGKVTHFPARFVVTAQETHARDQLDIKARALKTLREGESFQAEGKGKSTRGNW
jgi:hypothetical protein